MKTQLLSSTYFLIIVFFIPLRILSKSSTESEKLSQFSKLRGNGLAFTENQGQIIDVEGNLRSNILYKGQGIGMDIYLRKEGVSYVFRNSIKHAINEKQNVDVEESKHERGIDDSVPMSSYRIDMNFVGSNSDFISIPSEQLEGYHNFYYGYLSQEITNVISYNQVLYQNLYPNIDVKWYGNKKNGLKYDIVVQPGGDPAIIKQEWKGTNDMHISTKGGLIINTGIEGEELHEYMPLVYQEINGERLDITASYNLKKTGEKASGYSVFEVSLIIGEYNNNYPLTIDPWVTYLGGSGHERYTSLAVDGNENVFISGQTSSNDFPVLGASQATLAGGADNFFLSKFDSEGVLLWSTYLGGTSSDSKSKIAVDGQGNVILAGTSRSIDFPVLGAFQTTLGGGADHVVAKFNSSGTLLWSSYLGGSGWEEIPSLVIDGLDNIILTGLTFSANLPTLNAFQAASGGGKDAFISKISPTGTLLWSTYLGGNGPDLHDNSSITYNTTTAIDGLNNIIITGETQSSNFPTLNAFQPFPGGGLTDVFVSKFNPAGNLLWSTYLGGNGNDNVPSVAIDGQENVIIVGYAAQNFPIAGIAFQTAFGGGGVDAFVTKFNPSGVIQWSTYLGGNAADLNVRLAIDGLDNVVVVGATKSLNFPTQNAFQPTFGGIGVTRGDLFISKFNSLGSLQWSSYYGGSGGEEFSLVAIDKNDDIVIAGDTYEQSAGSSSNDFPTSGSCIHQSVFGGGREDNFISRISADGLLECSSYLGGSGNGVLPPNSELLEFYGDMVVSNGVVYLSGYVRTIDFPATPGAFQENIGNINGVGLADAYLAQICLATCGAENLSIDFVATDTFLTCNSVVSFTDITPAVCDTTGITWTWSFPGGSPTSSTLQNPTNITYDTEGNYDVTLEIVTPCETNTFTKSSYITVSGTSVTITPVDPFCLNDTANILKASDVGGTWQGNGIIDSIFSPIQAGTGTHQVIYTLCGAADTIDIIVHAPPTLVAQPSNATIQLGEQVPITVLPAGLIYSWSPVLGLDDTISNTPIAKPEKTTTYMVTATDTNGCSSEVMVLINVESKQTPLIWLPSIFSPNGDGNNDHFVTRTIPINTKKIKEYTLTIYNRWGQEVFKQTTNPANEIKWDGKYKGKELNNGVYIWLMDITLGEEEEKNAFMRGNVTLLR